MTDEQSKKVATAIENVLSFVIAIPLAGVVVYSAVWCIIWGAYNVHPWTGWYVHDGVIPYWQWSVFFTAAVLYGIMTIIKRWRWKRKGVHGK